MSFFYFEVNMSKKEGKSGSFKAIHWADATADRIIRQCGDKDSYTVASGITPSGVVHFGNFRETITVDFVARALRDRGKKVRFIFSWDDYDTFRKVPANMPKQEELKTYMFQPIVDTPDPYGEAESYASHHERNYEAQLSRVGVNVEAIYQAKKYKKGDYKEQIKKTLAHTKDIKAVLDAHRKEPLREDWLPLSIYCEECNRDKIATMSYDGDNTVHYTCELCGHKGSLKLDETSRAKLPWRMDWPMRWAYESVDFEPGGKDHSSEGGSFTTAKEIVGPVYGGKPPIYLQYEFVSIKGAGGKMSSSSGNVITLKDVLDIYEPEMVRWIFASYKSNAEFSVSFDLDVIKTYEDFDRQERLAFGVDQGNQKKVAMAKRVYEISSISEIPKEMPFQPAFRHLCNILQIHNGNLEKVREAYKDEIKNERDERRLQERSERALFWINNYAPEDFKFKINDKVPKVEMDDLQRGFLKELQAFLGEGWDSITTDKELHEKLYEMIHKVELQPSDAFTLLYGILISKEKGPKLAGFMRIIGKEKIASLLGDIL